MKYLTISGLSRFLNNLKKLIPSKTSQLTNDSGYITADQVSDVTGYSKTEVDYLINQTDSNAVHLTGNETIEGSKTFTSFPTLYYGAGDNYLSFLKSSSLIFGTAPQNTQTYSIRCLDKNDIIISEFSSQAQANGINNLSLRVRNTDGTNIYDRRINFNINTSGLTYFAPNIDNICSLGVADHQWKSVYANSYYLGNTAFGDIVTHNASEFLTSHQSLSNYVTLDGAQTISGEKTWTGTNRFSLSLYQKGFSPRASVPSSNEFGQFGIADTDNSMVMSINYANRTTGVRDLTFRVYDSAGNTNGAGVFKDASNSYSFCSLDPNNAISLGNPGNQWSSVYANSYYLGNTQFGDIVTHNASEFLTSHQSLSNYVTLDGVQTISGEKIFSKYPRIKPTTANNGLIYIQAPDITFGTAPSTTYTYALRCLDSEGTILADFLAQSEASGYTTMQLRVRNTDGTNVYDRRIVFNVKGADGATAFRPNADAIFNLGTSSYKWSAVYSNSYYLGSTAFGDIVTHNASEYASSSHTHTVNDISDFPTLATVATSGSYNDLSNKPTIPTVNNATLTIQKNGTTVKTFTANASSNVTANITVPTKVSELTNDSGYLTSHQPLSNYVTTNTEQTVTGNKEFASNSYVTVRGYRFRIKNDSMVLGTVPSSNQWTGIQFVDSNYAPISEIIQSFQSNGNSLYQINVYPNEADSEKRALLAYTYNSSNGANYVGFSSSLIPLSTNVYDLGSSTNRWKAVYAQEYHAYNANAFMANSGGYTFLIRNDGTNTYFLISEQNGAEGTWSTARPLTIANSTGVCNINGNAATATKATGNASGNELTNTIIKGLSVSGKTITYTKIDGNTGTLTTQDTVYTHPTTAGNKHVPSGGSSGQFLGWDSDGTAKWVNNPNSDTKNTAGSTNTSSKIFLIGATSQAANPQTYSHDTAYVGTDGCLYSGGTKVLTEHQSLSNYSTKANTVKSLSISGKTITVTPGSGDAYTLTTQDTTYSNFVKSGSGAKAGLVPSPGTTAGTTKYLREDGTWQVPPDHTYTVNNATLTIQKNGSNVATFTSNASSNVTANITVPTKTSELTNDSGFLTSHQSLANYLTKTTNISEMGRYIDMHYDNATAAYDYDVRLYVSAQGTAKGGGTFAIAAASVTAPNLTVTNNASNGIKFGSYTLYVG